MRAGFWLGVSVWPPHRSCSVFPAGHLCVLLLNNMLVSDSTDTSFPGQSCQAVPAVALTYVALGNLLKW